VGKASRPPNELGRVIGLDPLLQEGGFAVFGIKGWRWLIIGALLGVDLPLDLAERFDPVE
jgi:hypothetical protein